MQPDVSVLYIPCATGFINYHLHILSYCEQFSLHYSILLASLENSTILFILQGVPFRFAVSNNPFIKKPPSSHETAQNKGRFLFILASKSAFYSSAARLHLTKLWDPCHIMNLSNAGRTFPPYFPKKTV